MAVAWCLKPRCASDMQKDKACHATQHCHKFNKVIYIWYSSSKTFKTGYDVAKSLNIIKVSNCNHPSKRLKIGHLHDNVLLLL